MSDLSTAAPFLHALFDGALEPDVTITWRAIRHDRADPRQGFHLTVERLITDPQLATLNHQGWSLYVGIAPRRSRDGTKAGCVGIPTLWADLDAKDFAATREEGKRVILEQLERCLPASLAPSILVDTGAGFQAYWLLRELALIGGDRYTVDTLERYLRGLQRHLGADLAASDISRVLRLPGTVNCKYTDRPLCHVVHLDLDRRFNLVDFDGYLATDRAAPEVRNPAGWADELLRGVDGPDSRPAGAIGRDQAGAKLAGRYLRLGLTDRETLTALRGWNLQNRPPLPDEDLQRIVRSIGHADARHTPALAPTEAPPLEMPAAGMVGIAKDFADLYASHLESPRAFFYFSFLTYLGALLANRITLESELRPQPRLYTVLLGESADTRKSTALRKVDEFFRSLGPQWEPTVLFGIGSAEGIAAELKEDPELILHFDEFKSFVDKAKNEHSVALPMVSTLFERDTYDNRTKEQRLSIRGAALSLVAACTGDTYATMFDQKFIAIGFPNRLWLVSDRSTARIAVPSPIPDDDVEALRRRTHALLADIDAAYTAHGSRPVPYRLTPRALELYKAWYAGRQGSIFERRLDTYAHRLMLLLAASSGQTVVDEDLTERVIALLRYQLDVRREYDPVDAENTIAAMEEKIRRALARGTLKGRDLKKRVHYERVGTWIWNTAKDNLVRAGEVAYDRSLDLYWLKPEDEAVPTSVPTTKARFSANAGE